MAGPALASIRRDGMGCGWVHSREGAHMAEETFPGIPEVSEAPKYGDKTFGQWLKEVMRPDPKPDGMALRKPQDSEGLAKAVNVDKKTIENWLNDLRVPSTNNFTKLLEKLIFLQGESEWARTRRQILRDAYDHLRSAKEEKKQQLLNQSSRRTAPVVSTLAPSASLEIPAILESSPSANQDAPSSLQSTLQAQQAKILADLRRAVEQAFKDPFWQTQDVVVLRKDGVPDMLHDHLTVESLAQSGRLEQLLIQLKALAEKVLNGFRDGSLGAMKGWQKPELNTHLKRAMGYATRLCVNRAVAGGKTEHHAVPQSLTSFGLSVVIRASPGDNWALVTGESGLKTVEDKYLVKSAQPLVSGRDGETQILRLVLHQLTKGKPPQNEIREITHAMREEILAELRALAIKGQHLMLVVAPDHAAGAQSIPDLGVVYLSDADSGEDMFFLAPSTALAQVKEFLAILETPEWKP